jgi:hypothetical protein
MEAYTIITNRRLDKTKCMAVTRISCINPLIVILTPPQSVGVVSPKVPQDDALPSTKMQSFSCSIFISNAYLIPLFTTEQVPINGTQNLRKYAYWKR